MSLKPVKVTVFFPSDMDVSEDRARWYIEGAIRGWWRGFATENDPIREMSRCSVAVQPLNPSPATKVVGLDWSNFDGPKRNVEWTPDDQDLIYTALNYRDDDYGDADEDVGQQIVERLLAAWKRASETQP